MVAFKAVCDINDPTKLHEYQDIVELFDPRINKYFSDECTGPQFLAFLKSIYQRDLLKAHLKQFFGNTFNYIAHGDKAFRAATEQKLRTLIDETEDSDLFGLFLCNYRDNGFRFRFYPVKTEVGATAKAAAAFLATELSKHKTGIRYGTAWDAAYRDCAGGLLLHLINYTTDALGFGVQESRSWTPSQVADAFERNPSGCSLELRLEGVHLFSHFLEMASDNYRTPVCRTLPYQTDVLGAIVNSTADRIKGPCNKTLYGVELELTTHYNTDDLVKAQRKLFAIFKQDSTISGAGPNKVEMVTLPLYLEEHRSNFADWFAILEESKFDQTVINTNGMHVHIEKRALQGSLHLRKFVWFYTFPGNTNFVHKISERGGTGFSEYCRMPVYSNYKNKSRAFLDCVKHTAARGAIHSSRNKPTIEVRVFKGVVSFATILKNLEFVDATIAYTKDASLQALTVGHFLDWLADTPRGKYTVLKQFLKEINDSIASCIQESELACHVFNESNPTRITEILKDKNIEIGATHVKFLNKMVGSKLFDSLGGKVILNRRNFGKVSHLDKDLIERYRSEESRACV